MKELFGYFDNEYNKALPQNEVFSPFNDHHLKQAVTLYKVFYYAKSFDVFYKTAVWARYNLNQGLYLYALSVAILHRPDTYGIALPAIYEVYPYYFYNAEVIAKVQAYQQHHLSHPNPPSCMYFITIFKKILIIILTLQLIQCITILNITMLTANNPFWIII